MTPLKYELKISNKYMTYCDICTLDEISKIVEKAKVIFELSNISTVNLQITYKRLPDSINDW